jgi:preprotein translocase subunit YajC
MELGIFLQGQTPQAQPGGSWVMPVFMVGVFIVMYFFFLLPQKKKQAAAKKKMESMQKGDKVVTIAGIHGTIFKVNDDGTMMLETNPGSYLKIEMSTISPEWTNRINNVTASK